MINELLKDNETSVKIISQKRYEELTKDKKAQVKGKSSYEEYWLLEYLPKNKEFYVLEDYYQSYPSGGDEWEFGIATTYKGMYFVITAWGGN